MRGGAVTALLRREVRLRLRGGGWAVALGFFAVVCGVAPLALGREPSLIAAAGPGVIWVAAALSVLLGLDGLYEEDRAGGALDAIRLSPAPLAAYVLAKALAGWLATGLPLALLSPLVLLTFGRTGPEAAWGALGLLIGTPALALLATALGALTASLRRAAGLVVFLALPLFVPALVFGPDTMSARPGGAILLLGAFSLQALAVCPFVGAAALRAGD